MGHLPNQELIAGFWMWKVNSWKKQSNGSNAAPIR